MTEPTLTLAEIEEGERLRRAWLLRLSAWQMNRTRANEELFGRAEGEWIAWTTDHAPALLRAARIAAKGEPSTK